MQKRRVPLPIGRRETCTSVVPGEPWADGVIQDVAELANERRISGPLFLRTVPRPPEVNQARSGWEMEEAD